MGSEPSLAVALSPHDPRQHQPNQHIKEDWQDGHDHNRPEIAGSYVVRVHRHAHIGNRVAIRDGVESTGSAKRSFALE